MLKSLLLLAILSSATSSADSDTLCGISEGQDASSLPPNLLNPPSLDHWYKVTTCKIGSDNYGFLAIEICKGKVYSIRWLHVTGPASLLEERTAMSGITSEAERALTVSEDPLDSLQSTAEEVIYLLLASGWTPDTEMIFPMPTPNLAMTQKDSWRRTAERQLSLWRQSNHVFVEVWHNGNQVRQVQLVSDIPSKGGYISIRTKPSYACTEGL